MHSEHTHGFVCLCGVSEDEPRAGIQSPCRAVSPHACPCVRDTSENVSVERESVYCDVCGLVQVFGVCEGYSIPDALERAIQNHLLHVQIEHLCGEKIGKQNEINMDA